MVSGRHKMTIAGILGCTTASNKNVDFEAPDLVICRQKRYIEGEADFGRKGHNAIRCAALFLKGH